VVMPVNIGENRINSKGIARICPADVQRLRRHLLEEGDIVYSRRGDVERRALVRRAEAGWLCGTGCLRIRLGKSVADPAFAAYYLGHPSVRAWIVRHAIGATMLNLNTGILEALPFVLPPLRDQQHIATFLSALDDKIELNRCMNQTLEAMACAIFKAWFVDFDPIREEHPHWAHSFRESSLGIIPGGWGVGVLKDFVEDTIGGDWGEAAPSNTDSEAVLCIRGADIPYLQDAALGKMPVRFLSSRSLTRRILRHGDIVIEISGGSPDQSTGRCVLIRQRMLDRLSHPLVCSNFCRILRPRLERLSNFLYFWLDWLYSKDKLLQYENGTTGIKNLAFRTFSEVHPLVFPPEPILQAFDDLTSPLLDRQQCNGVESSTLATFRDTLLPKLLSGEIRVKQAEKIVGEAV
jgi:type I restriction enzyme, S subunit